MLLALLASGSVTDACIYDARIGFGNTDRQEFSRIGIPSNIMEKFTLNYGRIYLTSLVRSIECSIVYCEQISSENCDQIKISGFSPSQESGSGCPTHSGPLSNIEANDAIGG